MSAPAPQIAATRHGQFLICNPQETIQAALLRDGGFEFHGIVLAVEVLRHKLGDIVDVGANIGIFTVPVAAACPDRKVYSFEPQRNVFTHFCANLALNRLQNVHAHRLAVGVSKPGDTIQVPEFDIFEERYTGSVTLDPSVVAKRGAIAGIAEPTNWAKSFDTVGLVQLDDFLPPSPIAYMKVDVEGMELSVFRSAERILERDHPALYFEAWGLPQFAESNAALMQYVSDKGYKIWRIGNDCLAVHQSDGKALAHLESLFAAKA